MNIKTIALTSLIALATLAIAWKTPVIRDNVFN